LNTDLISHLLSEIPA